MNVRSHLWLLTGCLHVAMMSSLVNAFIPDVTVRRAIETALRVAESEMMEQIGLNNVLLQSGKYSIGNTYILGNGSIGVTNAFKGMAKSFELRNCETERYCLKLMSPGAYSCVRTVSDGMLNSVDMGTWLASCSSCIDDVHIYF